MLLALPGLAVGIGTRDSAPEGAAAALIDAWAFVSLIAFAWGFLHLAFSLVLSRDR
jgi:hypothetical protein